jgi:hypothetical protein
MAPAGSSLPKHARTHRHKPKPHKHKHRVTTRKKKGHAHHKPAAVKPRPKPTSSSAVKPTKKPVPKPAPRASVPKPAKPPATPYQPPVDNAPIPVFSEPTTVAHMRRLLWRAGFGPAPGQAEALAGQPLTQVIYGLTRPAGPANLIGPEPVDQHGAPLAPADAWGHDHCWWLDRMVRSDQPLVERMTFIWHDWFATSNSGVNDQQQMLDQNALFRANALGNFHDLFAALTTDPAMLIWLNGTQNNRWHPNENYAREMMELFSLGADRGAYTEDDVRQMARALTGWRNDWSSQLGNVNFRFDPSYHDTTAKTVFGQSGNWGYTDAVSLCVSHPLHASFFVTKLWGYFVPTPPDAATQASLEALYTGSGYGIRPVVEAILQHPDFYEGPELVTPPVVFNAGLLRAAGRCIDTTDWAWLSATAGQQLFYPPNVAGWDFGRWLDTATCKARWDIANYVTANSYVNPWPTGGSTYDPAETAAAALTSAMAHWGDPLISAETQQCIAGFAHSCLQPYPLSWQQAPYRAIRQNALRMLIATSPDMQVS